MFLAAPAILGAVYLSFIYSESLMGRPYYSKPSEFIYVMHKTDILEDQKWITLLAIVEGDDRLYRFAWDERTQKELDAGAKRAAQGRVQKGEFPESRKRNSESRDNAPFLKMYDLPIQELLPK